MFFTTPTDAQAQVVPDQAKLFSAASFDYYDSQLFLVCLLCAHNFKSLNVLKCDVRKFSQLLTVSSKKNLD